MNKASHLLGAVLAGGGSTRFGTDKAEAVLNGRTLLDHAVSALEQWCDAVIIVGRTHGGLACVSDWPAPGLGPLGAIAAALRYAKDHGFSEVLSCGVDSPGLPTDLPELLGPAPAYVGSQPVIGRWPVSALPQLEAILTGTGSRAMRAFADDIGAHPVALPINPANVNTPDDLSSLL